MGDVSMPKKKRNELTAGLFVIAAIVVALGVVLWLGAADVFQAKGQRVHFFAPVRAGDMGVTEGNVVKLGGVEVGKVVEVRLLAREATALYVAELSRRDIQVFSDGKATAVAPPIGSPIIVISETGSPDKPPADRDHPIELRLGGVMGTIAALSEQLAAELDKSRPASLMAKVHSMLTKLETTADTASKIAADIKSQTDAGKADSMLAGIRRSVADLNDVTANLRRQVDPEVEGSLLAKVHRTMDDVVSITGDARPKVSRVMTAAVNTAEAVEAYTKKDVAELLKKLHETNGRVLKIAGDFTAVSEKIKKTVLVKGDLIDEIIDDMSVVAANLKATSKEVRRSPWRLIHKPAEREVRSQDIYDAARAFLGGAEELDQAMTKLKGLATAHPQGIPPEDPTLKKIQQHLARTFRRFSEAEQALWRELSR
jgi:ABC-type transporter Mla subunit MlaD